MATLKLYTAAAGAFLRGDIDLINDTIKVSLHTASYTPDQDVHDFYDDVTDEVSGSGYIAGGGYLTSKVLNVDTAQNRIKFLADDLTWLTSTIQNVRWGVIYKDTGLASTSRLIAYIDFGGTVASSNSDFVIDWDATNGIFYTETP